jgi:putative hydrolase of the HAD superfamily
MSMLRAALFDLDDTLISSYANPGPAWRSVVREFATMIDADRIEAVGEALAHEMAQFLRDDENRRLWRLKAVATRRQAVRDALLRCDFPAFADLAGEIADRYAAFREESMALHEGAHEVLDFYRAQGVRLGLVTNGATETQRMKIERFDLAHRFDHIQIEEEAGFGKPDGRAYVVTLAALGVAPEAAQMTGDDLVWDVAAPKRLGMRAVWFNPFNLAGSTAVLPDMEIHALTDLLPDGAATLPAGIAW